MELDLMEKQLKAVADANRLRILACLKKGEVCVCDFIAHFQNLRYIAAFLNVGSFFGISPMRINTPF